MLGVGVLRTAQNQRDKKGMHMMHTYSCVYDAVRLSVTRIHICFSALLHRLVEVAQ